MVGEYHKTPEERAEEIEGSIEILAQKEGMTAGEIFEYMKIFAELCQQDEDAKAYFEELAEKIGNGTSAEELIEYAINRAKEELG